MTFEPHIDDRVSATHARATGPQIAYVRGMQQQLHLSDRLLDMHCEAQFGLPFEQLNRRQMSSLIEEMKDWQSIPAQLLREAGQLELLG